jgi:glutathione-regulated potassium-efflux system ancillary protein KefC/glutathione-regulated potassium-efflux system protein KefB
MEFLRLTTLFLISAVIVVPIFHRLNLGAVLGYLIAGMIIGPSGLGLISNPESIFKFSEFGVIFLMFIIGLELQPSRLWVLRRSVFGLGAAQVAVTTLLVFGLGIYMGCTWQGALVLGLGLSMSSTALVLQSLAEREQLSTSHGRDAFAVLLFQDLAVIPILALLPLLSPGNSTNAFSWTHALLSLAVIIGFVAGGRLILRRAFKWIASVENRDLFTVASLLIVIGSAGIMHSVGLSMGLGAFLAGVLLSDSEYRHELEADIEPFKGLLLGLFFISIGMSAKIGLIWENPFRILGLVLLLYFIKSAAILLIKRILHAHHGSSRKLAVYLSQGGEFAFVLFAAAVASKVLDQATSELFVIVVTMSMIFAPILFVLEDRYFSRKLDVVEEPHYDTEIEETPVIIAGFGRFGQIIGRLLTLRKIKFTALDKSSAHVDFIRRFGNKIFYGDASRLDVLNSAKVASAKLFVLAIDNVDESLKTAELVRKHFPHVPVFARARNRFHSYKLLDLGVEVLYRDTWFSSIEMGRKVLIHMGLSQASTDRLIEQFKKYDEELLLRQHAVYQNETQLIQTSRQALADLESLFESDAKEAEETSQ